MTTTRPRRRLASWGVASIAAASLLVSGLPAVAAAASPAGSTAEAAGKDWSFNPVTALTADTFASPPDTDMPWVRWNLSANPAIPTLEAQLQEMYDKGIRGVEIGQGGFPDNERLAAIYTKANALGIKVSLSHGPTKGVADFNADNARKSLFVGRTTVDAGATFSAAVPRPNAQAGRNDTLVALLAYKCADAACAPTGAVALDRASAVDLTSTVTGTNSDGFADGSTAGNVTWTAPADPAGTRWQLIGFWARGVFAQSDPLSAAGHQEVVDAMRAYFTPEVTALIRANGGDIFYDSHSSDRGAPREVWTNTFDTDFEERKGYDLIPNLAAAMRGTFTFTDGSHGRIHDDITEARTDLWMDVHLLPIQQFVKDEYDLVLRVQPEGENSYPIYDMAAVASVLDRPEHENLYASDEIDNYLPVASANHMTGNPWYSTECCALGSGNYVGTFEDMSVRMAKSYAGGITKLIYHTYAYSDSPTHRWPGYANWGNTSFGTAWGPRTPIWEDALAYNKYFARHDQVLTQGDAKVDVAVFYQNYLYPEAWSTNGGFRTWRDMGLQNAGYTRDYLSPELMKLPNAVVTDGRLAVQGPNYKALIIDTALEPASDPVKTSMPLDAAERILGYAKSGLPVLLVGALPDRTTGNTPGDDAALQSVIAQLVATPGVHRVANQAAVPSKLKELGIRPAAEPSEATTLVSQRRVDTATETSYHFLYNEGRVGADGRPEQSIFEPAEVCAGTGGHTCSATGNAVTTTVSIEGDGYPFLLDATSGEITPIAAYTVADGRVSIPLHFERDESKIIALSKDADRFGEAALPVHAIDSDADAGVVFDGSDVIARSTRSGDVTTTFSNGVSRTTAFGPVPSAIELTGATWTLRAEDWRPTNDWATTFGPAAAETTKTEVTATLDGLKPWRQIPGLENASGTGQYSTTFTLPEGWTSDNGAVLDLGTVVDTFRLTVNGESVAVDQTTGRVDLRDQLKAGENTIEVRVATTLINRLASLDTAVANRRHLQNYGLLGPVVLTPYASASLSTAEVDGVATPRVLGGKVYLSVSATNALTVAADVVVTTAYGSKTFKNVAPGKTVAVSINTRLASVAAGEAAVSSTAVLNGETVSFDTTAPFGAFPIAP